MPQTFCFTGPLYENSRSVSRSAIEIRLAAIGDLVLDRFAKDIDCLVMHSAYGGTEKSRQARRFGIRIWSHAEFLHYLHEQEAMSQVDRHALDDLSPEQARRLAADVTRARQVQERDARRRQERENAQDNLRGHLEAAAAANRIPDAQEASAPHVLPVRRRNIIGPEWFLVSQYAWADLLDMEFEDFDFLIGWNARGGLNMEFARTMDGELRFRVPERLFHDEIAVNSINAVAGLSLDTHEMKKAVISYRDEYREKFQRSKPGVYQPKVIKRRML